MFRVTVLFLLPVVDNLTCHMCLLVWCGCCVGYSAAVTIVITDLSGSKLSPPHCRTLSAQLMDPVNVGNPTMRLSFKPHDKPHFIFGPLSLSSRHIYLIAITTYALQHECQHSVRIWEKSKPCQTLCALQSYSCTSLIYIYKYL
jgi:hypothetical protein